MGIVVEEVKGPCECFRLNGEDLCHKKGVIGFLSNKQERELCTTKITEPAPAGLKARHREFAEAADICSKRVREKYPKGERLLPYLACMDKEAEKRGIKL
ncbi:MAG: hypothetical protein ACTSUF_03460 [Candidatus Heimdallarchaeaceae archaeon]